MKDDIPRIKAIKILKKWNDKIAEYEKRIKDSSIDGDWADSDECESMEVAKTVLHNVSKEMSGYFGIHKSEYKV